MKPFTANDEVVDKLNVYPYPTQRLELNGHAFSPLYAGDRDVLIPWHRDE